MLFILLFIHSLKPNLYLYYFGEFHLELIRLLSTIFHGKIIEIPHFITATIGFKINLFILVIKKHSKYQNLNLSFIFLFLLVALFCHFILEQKLRISHSNRKATLWTLRFRKLTSFLFNSSANYYKLSLHFLYWISFLINFKKKLFIFYFNFFSIKKIIYI